MSDKHSGPDGTLIIGGKVRTVIGRDGAVDEFVVGGTRLPITDWEIVPASEPTAEDRRAAQAIRKARARTKTEFKPLWMKRLGIVR